MRTYEERVGELHQRMQARRRHKAVRRVRTISAAIYAAGMAAAALFALLISAFPLQVSPSTVGGATASIFADHEALGYVVVAILAFCLGLVVTVLCYRLNRRIREEGLYDG